VTHIKRPTGSWTHIEVESAKLIIVVVDGHAVISVILNTVFAARGVGLGIKLKIGLCDRVYQVRWNMLLTNGFLTTVFPLKTPVNGLNI